MAATRFRVSQYIDPLREYGIDTELISFLNDEQAASLYSEKHGWQKARGIIASAVQILGKVLKHSDYNLILIQREAALIGPPLVELCASRAGKIPIVLDIDDAIWMPSGRLVMDLVRLPWKAHWIARQACQIVAGSRYLGNWAKNLGKKVTIAPTVVPATTWTPRPERAHGAFAGKTPVIGWVGTHSTASQLSMAVPALNKLRLHGHKFTFRVVGASQSRVLDGFDCEKLNWREETEIDTFRDIDIGIAPMFNEQWHQGKCAFKQIQYMTVGVPHVSSCVGATKDFIINNSNGLFAHDHDAWYTAIRRLLEDQNLRTRISIAGRKLIEQELCAEVMAKRMAEVILTASAVKHK